MTDARKPAHTPLPWRVETWAIDNANSVIVLGHKYGAQAQVADCSDPAWKESAIDAEFIVRACNAHDDLVAALREAMGVYGLMAIRDKDDHTMLDGWLKLEASVRATLKRAEET